MTGILDQFEDIADANNPKGNYRDRRGAKEGQGRHLFYKSKSVRARIKAAQKWYLKSKATPK